MRPRHTVVAVVGILILGLALPSSTNFLPSSPKAHGANHGFALSGDAGRGWNNTFPGPTIPVTEKDTVSVLLDSIDGAPHRLYIDADNIANFDCSSSIDKCSGFFGNTNPNPITYPFNVDFAAGNYTYYCSIHPFSMRGTFVVLGFRISSSPNSITIVRGSSAMSTIALTSVNGFSGTASLSAIPPAGLLTSLNSSSVSLAANGKSAASLTVNVPSTTAAGTYNILVNATIGSISHTTSVAVVVKKLGFSVSANPAQLVMVKGSSKTTNVTLTSLNTFSGNVSLSASPPAGVTTAFTPTSVTLNSGQPATSTLNVTVASSAISGEYNLTLTGASGSETNTTNVRLVIGPDFDLTASPVNLTVLQGSLTASRITLTSVNSFQGNVTLSSPGTPVGLTVSFNTTSVSLSPGQTAYASVTISAFQSAVPKVYGVTVTGTNSARVRSVNLNITVSGFTIQASKALFNLTQGTAGSSTITLTSINGFSGTTNLTVTGGSALTRSLTPSSSVVLKANEILTVTLAFSTNGSAGLTPLGSYVFNVTGKVGSLSHSTTVAVTVTALPPSHTPSGSFPTVLVAGIGTSLVALLFITLFLLKRRGVKTKSQAVPPSTDAPRSSQAIVK